MGRVVAFSDFDSYYSSVQKDDFLAGTILDTNILISLSYEIKPNHDEVTEFFEHLEQYEFDYFATVNTKSEFLDFHRRLLTTEYLRDAIDEHSHWRIPSRAKAQIQTQSGQLVRRQKQGGDPVFTDTQIKAIKSSFSAGQHSGQMGWLSFCEKILTNRLQEIETLLLEYGVGYLSQNDTQQAEFFGSLVEWPGAQKISERTCVSISDAMILNAFQCSRFPFLISSDFDIGYAVLASKEMKDVIAPDSVAKKYRDYHFESQDQI